MKWMTHFYRRYRRFGNSAYTIVNILHAVYRRNVFQTVLQTIKAFESLKAFIKRHSPNIAVLLNIFPEHLDHYVSFEAYAQAKRNICRFQGAGDTTIVNSVSSAPAVTAAVSATATL